MKVLRNSKVTPVIGLIIGAVIGLVCFRLTYVNAGNLEPSAAPGPTMKTLDEVEARIPISGSTTPLGTFTISKSDSYYLTGNRSCSGTGIAVNVDDVTIDLNGYSLIGPGSGTNNGIYMSGRKNVEIRNGTIRSFGSYGIAEDTPDGKCHRVFAVTTSGNGAAGIFLGGFGHIVKNCTSLSNAEGGIYSDWYSMVTGNTVRQNGETGIYASHGSLVEGNLANQNGNSGIGTGFGSTVINNTSYENEQSGIECGSGSMVLNNTVRENNTSDSDIYAGIRASSYCFVRGNIATSNNQNNIFTNHANIVVENNLVTDSTFGIFFYPTMTGSCFYANNRASGNTTNYGGDVPAGAGDGGGNAEF